MHSPQIIQSKTPASDTGRIGHPILDWPLTRVMSAEYALPLQHVLGLYTVGNLLSAWQEATAQKSIEEIFQSPDQAHQAIATCAAWVGFRIVAAPAVVPAWWR